MRFSDIGLVRSETGKKLSGAPGQAIKKLDADGKICRVNHPYPAAFDGLADVFDAVVPARRSHDQVAAHGGDPGDIVKHGGRVCEVEADVNPLEVFGRNARAAAVRLGSQDEPDRESSLRGELRDGLAHFPVPEQGEVDRIIAELLGQRRTSIGQPQSSESLVYGSNNAKLKRKQPLPLQVQKGLQGNCCKSSNPPAGSSPP